MANSDSTRFVVQMIMNVLICNYAKKKIAKIATKEHGKRAFKSYLIFLAFAVILIGLNQTVYFIFKQRNLYEQLNIPRNMPAEKIQSYSQDLKIQIMQIQKMPMHEKMENIKKIQAIVQVLTHPARRLSYDTFGQTETNFAWSFKNHYFLLSSIIGASIFYIMCTFFNMISDKKGEIKAVFKLQIMVMILLFLWQVELILKTQTRIHQQSDSLDTIYTAFPYFQRRQMIKIILIPCMNIIKFFYRFYVTSDSQKKFISIAKNPQLRQLTAKTSQIISKVQPDEHLQDKVLVAVKQAKKHQNDKADIFASQRKILQSILVIEGENILLDKQVYFACKYFNLLLKKKQQ